jgi:hypothetical protein
MAASKENPAAGDGRASDRFCLAAKTDPEDSLLPLNLQRATSHDLASTYSPANRTADSLPGATKSRNSRMAARTGLHPVRAALSAPSAALSPRSVI